MQLLLDIIATLGAGILVMLVPGAGILALTRLDRIVPAPLVPAAALALGLVPLAGLTAATLALHQPIEWVLAGLGLVTLWCWLRLASRVRAGAREVRRDRRDAPQPTWLQSLAEPVSDLIYGEWARGVPVVALAAAGAGTVIALLAGFHAWNDSLYHIGQAQKLLHLDAPTFDNTLQFADGSAHPGYFVPAWQEAIALTAWIARVDPVTAAWIIPSITTAVAILAMGGLAWTLTRTRGAASVGSLAWLVIAVGMLPFTDAITNGMHPGAVAIHVLLPLVLAMLFVAAWVEPWQVRDDAGPRVTNRAATFIAGVATAGIGVLHVSYLWVLGLGVLGYAVVWLLRGPWPRAVVMRHLWVGGTILVVAATCLALLLPGLGRLEQFGRDAKSELAANELGLHDGENAANLDDVVRGGTGDDRYHLRADYLVLAGGLTLLGLLTVPLMLFAPRWPGGWYLLGATALVLAIALMDRVFPVFVNTVSLDQARRIERVLPLALGLTMFALVVGAVAARARRAVAVAVSVAGAATIALLAARVPPLAGYGGEEIVEPRVLTTVFGILLVGALCWLATLVLRIAKRPLPLRVRVAQEWSWPTELLAGRATSIATLVLLVGAVPVYGSVGDLFQEGRLGKLPRDMRTAELRLFAPQVAEGLRELPTGSVVLADPRSRNGYMAMALAPVYTVSSVPRHTAFTPENRVPERFERAVSFIDGNFERGDGLTADERIELLLEEKVDAVILHPKGAKHLHRLLQSTRGITVAGKGTNQWLYLVDRDELRMADVCDPTSQPDPDNRTTCP